MKFLTAFGVIVALAVVAAQLNAARLSASAGSPAPSTTAPLVVGTSFPEPISTVFLLGGAVALGLWRMARKLEIV